MRQRADLFEFNISAKKISLPQGQSSQCSSGPRKANFVRRNIDVK